MECSEPTLCPCTFVPLRLCGLKMGSHKGARAQRVPARNVAQHPPHDVSARAHPLLTVVPGNVGAPQLIFIVLVNSAGVSPMLPRRGKAQADACAIRFFVVYA